MPSVNRNLNIISMSDVHLNHPRTPTWFIIDNLKKTLNGLDLKSIDLLIIAGDLLDRIMSLDSEDFDQFIDFSIWLISIARRNDITLRILEGTPSHDRRQSRIMDAINRNGNHPIDLKYVDTLSIEHLSTFGVDILYIPDEYSEDPDVTWSDVNRTLASNGLTQVDLVVMHGAFRRQLPMATNTHIEERYQSITRYVILIGHVHQYYRDEKIIAHGSFDRLCHGDESPKGLVLLTLHPDNTYTCTFIENKGAMIYKTIRLQGLSLDECNKRLKKYINYPPRSNFRLIVKRGDPISFSFPVVKNQYPQFNWSIEREENQTEKKRVTETKSLAPAMAITRDTLLPLMTERLKGVDKDLRERALTILKNHV